MPALPEVPDVFWNITANIIQTTSSSLFVTWQPTLDDIIPRVFTLTYCSRSTEDCKSHNLTNTYTNLTDLHPFTWYNLTLKGTGDINTGNRYWSDLASTAREYKH